MKFKSKSWGFYLSLLSLWRLIYRREEEIWVEQITVDSYKLQSSCMPVTSSTGYYLSCGDCKKHFVWLKLDIKVEFHVLYDFFYAIKNHSLHDIAYYIYLLWTSYFRTIISWLSSNYLFYLENIYVNFV